MGEQENARTVREVFEAWNAHDPDRLANLVDASYVAESDTIPAPVKGRDGLRDFIKVYIAGFPDLRLEVEQVLTSGDFAVSRWKATGTHRGVLMGIPPTNRQSVTHGCTVSQFRDGKTVHDWIYWDVANMLRQLGVMPGPK